MSEHPLDRVFRERLANQKVGPVDHLWAGIARQQARQRLRRRLFLGGSILSALLVVGALVLFLRTTTDNNTAPAEVPLQPIEQHPELLVPMAEGENATQDGAVPIAERPPDPPNPASSNAPIAANLNSSVVPSAYEENLLLDPNPTTLNRSRTSKLYDTEEQDASLQEIALAANELSSVSTTTTSAPSAVDLLLDTDLPTNIEPLQPRVWMLPAAASTTSSGQPITKTTRSRLEFEATIGPAYAYQILKAPSELNRPDLDAREISEFPEMSYSTTLRVNYRFPSRFSVRAGLSYTAIRNQFEYERRISPDELELVRSVNALRLLEIPLMLGYELPGQRFNLGLSAGPVINISTTAKGQYLNAESMDPLSLSDPTIYRPNAGLAWRVNLGTSYRLGDSGTRLLLEPTFTHYPRSFTRDDNPLSERYWMVGLQLGIKHVLR